MGLEPWGSHRNVWVPVRAARAAKVACLRSRLRPSVWRASWAMRSHADTQTGPCVGRRAGPFGELKQITGTLTNNLRFLGQ